MRIHLIAVGHRMPAWVEAGYREYAQRLPPECALQLTEVPLGKRGKGADVERLMRREAEKMLSAIPPAARSVALEVGGSPWSTEELAARIGEWMGAGRDVALLIGGPEGLHPDARGSAEQAWSLSRLTLPHPLVRVVVAEQIYRAWSILRGHPYHR